MEIDLSNADYTRKGKAHFRRKCPDCGEWIEEGDTIYEIEEEWVCETCWEDQ